MTADNSGQKLVDLAFGFVLTGALATAARFDIADRLASGAKTIDDLAAELTVDVPSLHRVLRTLASCGVFWCDDAGRYHLTPEAELLRSDAPGSLRNAVLMITHEVFWKPVGGLHEVVRSGENGMIPNFGLPFFEYFENNTEAGAIFHRGMSSLSDLENAPIAQSYDFTPFDTIVDVGGGHGGFLIEALKTAPAAKGINYDHAHVLDEARIDELPGRWRCETGDFLDRVPAGDAYLLKRIIHDWTDDVCVRILSNIRAAMPAHARVLVVDCVIPQGNEPHGGKVLDILMMSALPGRERTETEFAQLFAASGLTLSRVITTPALLSIVEAVASD